MQNGHLTAQMVFNKKRLHIAKQTVTDDLGDRSTRTLRHSCKRIITKQPYIARPTLNVVCGKCTAIQPNKREQQTHCMTSPSSRYLANICRKSLTWVVMTITRLLRHHNASDKQKIQTVQNFSHKRSLDKCTSIHYNSNWVMKQYEHCKNVIQLIL